MMQAGGTRKRRVKLQMEQGGDAPAPDPATAIAAQSQADVAQAQLQLGQEQLDYQKNQDAQWAPYYQKLADQEFDTSADAADRATQQWNQYTQTFEPIEDQVASDATNWDSAGGVADARAGALATSNAAFDQAQGTTERNLARAGVSADSGRSIESANEIGNARALAAGSASTNAATTRQMQGIALRTQAADLGRGIASGANASDNLSTTSGQGATGTLGSQAQVVNSGIATVGGLYSGATQSYGAEASTLNSEFGNEMAGYNAGQAKTGAEIGGGVAAAATIAAAVI